MADPSTMVPGDDVPAVLGPAFWSALEWVSVAHRDQIRKGKPKVPYVSHLLGVASLVLEAGGTETEAVAALLHDTIEDQDVSAADIRSRFGDRVEAIVSGCTDSLAVAGDEPEEPSPRRDTPMGSPGRGPADWRERKEAYLAHLAEESNPSILLVSCADKLHNARAMVADLRTGSLAWTGFNAPPEKQLWYYQSLREAFAGRVPAYLDQELRAAVVEIVERTDVSAETRAWKEAHPGDRAHEG